MYYIPYYPNDLRYASQSPSITEKEKEELAEITLENLQKDVVTIQLLDQLSTSTNQQQYLNTLNYTREIKLRNINQLDYLYRTITGNAPNYQTASEASRNTEIGIQDVVERCIEDYEGNYKASLKSSSSAVQQLYYQLSSVGYMAANQLYNIYHYSRKSNSATTLNRQLEDHGGEPFVIDIEEAAEQNTAYRTAIWTGEHLQVTLMSIPIGNNIGLEVHPNHDQFIRIEDGDGVVQMGNQENNLTYRRQLSDSSAVMIPAGTWHNITNTGDEPLKLYTIYAPPEHSFGTVHQTKADALASE
ncbi:cupin domain-containing protein [Oceanobacillus sp. 1P07AA]|uniref:cupin domain-containing protein n=1 Tax=Oceanobacillus sp. 1P07AA TaxID=3132293 RepID=UPI0039A69CA7